MAGAGGARPGERKCLADGPESLAARPRIRVVAAALLDADRGVLIAERPPGKHMAGRWEFPGGKVGAGESDLDALRRELQEELGVSVETARHCLTVTHAYDDRTVELSMWIVERHHGEPRELDGQRLKWVPIGQLPAEDILEADRPFIEALMRGAGRASAPHGR